MGFSTFTSVGVKEVLVGVWDLLCDGYLLIPSSLFASLLLFTIPVAAGKMGLQALNAVGLALVGDYLIGLAFPMVAATVLQAYISNAIQTGNWDNVRATFQRTALMWLALFFLIHLPILCNIDLILMLAGQDHELAHIAQIFIFIQLPRYFAMYIAYLCLMTMFAQDTVWPNLLTNFLNFLLVVVVEIFVVKFQCGVYILAVGVCACQLVTTAIVIGIFLIKESQWNRLDLLKFESSCFFEWSEMFCQTILSILQNVATRCILEVGVIYGGILSHVELGSATILRRYTSLISSIPHNLMAPVVCKSIGASIGKRSFVSVKVFIFSGLLMAFILGFIFTLISILFRRPLAAFMSSDSSVVLITSDLTTLVSILDWIILVYWTNIFIFRGLGSMAVPTIMGFCFQYGLSLPLSIILVFVAHLHLTGYYIALCISVILEFSVDTGYLHLFKLPALSQELESNEQQPLIENEIPLKEKEVSNTIIQSEDEVPQELPPTRDWTSRCWFLICAALIINGLAIGIHFLTNFIFG